MKNNKDDIDIEKRQLMDFDISSNGKRNFGHLTIPRYQRRYNWRADEIDSFMEEILTKANTLYINFPGFKERNGNLENILLDYSNAFLSPKVYFGNLVITLVENENKPDEIVDGQQRISTFAITLKLLSLMKDDIKGSTIYKDNIKAFSSLFRKLDKTLIYTNDIGDEKPLISSQNKHDKKYLAEVFAIESIKQITPQTNNAYIKNMVLIKKQLMELEQDRKLFFLLATLTTEFGIVSFSGEQRAFELFEALNSKGMQLSPSDLIKNLFFKIAHKTRINVSEKWDQLIELLSTKDQRVSPAKITSFMRSYFMVEENEYIKKKELFIKIKTKINKNNLESTMDKMIEVAEYFEYLKNGKGTSGNFFIEKEMSILYFENMPQIYQPLMAFFIIKKTEDGIFELILKYLFKQSYIHFAINNLPSKEIDKRVSLVISILMDEELTWTKIQNVFDKHIIVETFGDYTYEQRINALKTKDFDNRGKLLALYKVIYDYQTSSDELKLSLSEKKIDLEHLLPQTPGEWIGNGFEDKADADKYIKKIGNTLFIFGKINKTIQNNLYQEKLSTPLIDLEDKQVKLKDSKLFKREMEFAFGEIPKNWTKDEIDTRTKKIIKYLIEEEILMPGK